MSGSDDDGGRKGSAVPQHDVMRRPAVTLRIPATVDAPSLARRHVADSAASLLDEQRLDDARLLVSEIVTNAVRHAGLSAGDDVTVEVRPAERGVVVEVSDPGHGFLPSPRPDALVVGGWGLPLVQRLSDDWGVEDRPGGGSVVWFRVDAR
jgi:serine/threonine-protein kinase RsbW